MCKVISVANSKGGTGKTTTCVNLGIGLANNGYKVLLIDNDPQGSMTSSLGIQNPDDCEYSLTTILKELIEYNSVGAENADAIITHQEHVDFVPANHALADLNLVLKEEYGGEWILKEFVDSIRKSYDYVLIDCQPTLNYLTLNALCAANSILIPMEAAYLSLRGLEQMLAQVSKMRRRLNPNLEIEGILVTRINERTVYAKDIVEILKNAYGSDIRIFNSRIPRSVKVEECSAEGVSIYTYDPSGKAAAAYASLTKEVCGL